MVDKLDSQWVELKEKKTWAVETESKWMVDKLDSQWVEMKEKTKWAVETER